MTMAGSKGFSLSAGQRQRVVRTSPIPFLTRWFIPFIFKFLTFYKALARAVYSRRSIALLDDVFSQLDAHTSASIVSKLLGPDALYRQWGITVLLTTSSGVSSCNYKNRSRDLT